MYSYVCHGYPWQPERTVAVFRDFVSESCLGCLRDKGVICLTKSRSEFGIVSGSLLFRHVHGFLSFNRELSKLESSFAGYQDSSFKLGVATSTDTYSTKVFINNKEYLLMDRIISCCIWGLLSILLYLL